MCVLCRLSETELKHHWQSLVADMDLTEYDAMIALGGDGTLGTRACDVVMLCADYIHTRNIYSCRCVDVLVTISAYQVRYHKHTVTFRERSALAY